MEPVGRAVHPGEGSESRRRAACATSAAPRSEPAPPARLLDELRAVHGAMVAAVVAGAGLARVAELAAEAARAPVAVVVPDLSSALAPAGRAPAGELCALERFARDRARQNGTGHVPREVAHEIPIRLAEEVVGVVVLLRSELPPRRDAPEFLYPAASAALLHLAIEGAKREVERELRGALLEALRSGQRLDRDAIVRRAARLGCDLSAGAVILCADGEMPGRIVSIIASEHPGALVESVEAGPGRAARVYAALGPPAGAKNAQAVLASAQRVAERLRASAVVGVSSFHHDPAELGNAVQEAELMLEVVRQTDVDVGREIGGPTYRLLFRLLASHPDEVRGFYEATIAPAARYEAQYGIDLLGTLEAYLECNCNVSATATAIFAHRHTVAYRLERMHELTGLDPTHAEQRERLALGLKAHRILAPRSA